MTQKKNNGKKTKKTSAKNSCNKKTPCSSKSKCAKSCIKKTVIKDVVDAPVESVEPKKLGVFETVLSFFRKQ